MLINIVLYHFSYPYAGDVTINISHLHASLAHFDIMTDEFQAKVVRVGSMVDVADIIRSIGEQAHQTDMVNIITCQEHILYFFNTCRFGVLPVGVIVLGCVLILVR